MIETARDQQFVVGVPYKNKAKSWKVRVDLDRVPTAGLFSGLIVISK